MSNIDINNIEFRIVNSWIFDHATFVSMIYKGENFFDTFFEDLNDASKKSLLAKMRVIGNTHRSNWNPDIIENLINYPKQYCIKKLRTNNFRVSTTIVNFDGDIVILVLGFPKKSNESTKKIHQFYKKAQKYIDIIQDNKNEIRNKLRRIIK